MAAREKGDRLVIVGASHAGCRVAFAAREAGFTGEIVLIGAETVPPYQRPPLSKARLKGGVPLAALLLKNEAAFAEADITLRLDTRVVALDRAAHAVVLEDGARLSYTRLALTTGATARRLNVPGEDLAGVFTLRDLADSDALAASLPTAHHAVVIGGGFIGLEAAAVLRGLGLEVDLVEAQARLSARVFPPVMSHWLEALHESRGVAVHLGASVAEILGRDGTVSGVKLDDGTQLACDLVVIGIGVAPADGLARAAGLATDRGILVNAQALTSDPLIAAAGDCARHPNRYAPEPGALTLLESVQNANDQAKVAATSLIGPPAGAPARYDAVPWFWSEQYDIRIQMAGLPAPDDEIVPLGDPASGRFSLLHLRDGRLAAVDSIGRPQDHMAARRLLGDAAPVDRAAILAFIDAGGSTLSKLQAGA